MKTAIQLINEAYWFTGLVPSGKPASGAQSADGLCFLNDVLYELNCHNYFPFTFNTVDGHVTGGIGRISPGPSDSEFFGDKPIKVNKVLYKNGTEWIPLKDVAYENIWERRTQSSKPIFYAFSNDEDGTGVIVFDCENGDFDCRVIYNRAIPPMDFNDQLNAPPQYESVIKYSVCCLIAAQRGFPPEKRAEYKELRDGILESIKKANAKKHKIDMPYRPSCLDGTPSEMVLFGRVFR